MWAAILASSLALTGCFSGPPQIVALRPPAGSTQLDANATVEVVFDRPVDQASVAAHFTVCAVKNGNCKPGLPGCPDLSAAFSAVPNSPCWVSWLPTQPGFVLHHQGALFAPNTMYQFSLGAGVSSSDGTVNSLDHQWDLTSAAAPALTSATPANGATGVPRDVAMSLSFSRAMSLQAISAGIRLSPPVTGLRVIVDSLDSAAFEVLPEQPLSPATAYTLTLTQAVTDAQGQPLLAPVSLHFRTGQLSSGEHAVVLAGTVGGLPSAVAVAGLTSPVSGEPIPDEILAQAPVCQTPGGCAGIPQGQPIAAIEEAALAPGARWLAVVETGAEGVAGQPVLRVIDLATGQDRLNLAGARFPAWSPDGSVLAFVAGGTVQLYQPVAGSISSLEPASAPDGPPVWTAAGDTLAIPVAASAAGPAHLELAAPAVGALYSLPGLSGEVSRVVAAPTGEELAVQVTAPDGGTSAWVIDPSGDRPPTEIGAGLVPVGFTDDATLIAAAPSGSGHLAFESVNLGSGTANALAAAPGEPDFNSAAVDPSGRQLAYLDTTSLGQLDVLVANADGTGVVPLAGLSGALVPASISFSG